MKESRIVSQVDWLVGWGCALLLATTNESRCEVSQRV